LTDIKELKDIKDHSFQSFISFISSIHYITSRKLMDTIDLNRALEFALATAKKGADLAVEYHKAGADLDVENKSPRDFVTEADFDVQNLIIDEIKKNYPEHGVVAEEKGADNIGNPDSPYIWVIDPIDGTKPFMHGREEFGVILGLMKNEEVILGVMILPLQNDEFKCIKGQGVFYNNKPVVLRKTKDMNEAMICTNFRGRERIIDGIPYVPVPLCTSIENYGCAADELGKILKGQNDGATFHGPRIWDLAVGFMMIEEAGGKAEWQLDDPDDVRSAVLGCASTEPIFDDLRKFTFETSASLTLRKD
jgi:myo-inositol-1(or 4)-monophosphatase|tara:strand:+ start:2751 stop:3671 length:921 start_codon:yes stop_codon:yes gene_type:complete